MNERMVLVVETLGHWVLGWTLVVLAVAFWIGATRPRRAAVRYGGWLLATFAGAALAPIVLAVGPLASWREIVRVFRAGPQVGVVEASAAPAEFRSWFDGETSPFRTEPAVSRSADSIDRGEAEAIPGPFPPVAMAGTKADPPARAERWLSLAAGLWSVGFLLFALACAGPSVASAPCWSESIRSCRRDSSSSSTRFGRS